MTRETVKRAVCATFSDAKIHMFLLIFLVIISGGQPRAFCDPRGCDEIPFKPCTTSATSRIQNARVSCAPTDTPFQIFALCVKPENLIACHHTQMWQMSCNCTVTGRGLIYLFHSVPQASSSGKNHPCNVYLYTP